MCGLVGFLGGDCSNSQLSKDILKKMSDEILHRGPDSAGIWMDERNKVAMAHRRLAIVDLSPAGHQPMTSSSNRYVISYNGEIYNSSEIRRRIK